VDAAVGAFGFAGFCDLVAFVAGDEVVAWGEDDASGFLPAEDAIFGTWDLFLVWMSLLKFNWVFFNFFLIPQFSIIFRNQHIF
jgi:hypothetical protein